MVNQFLSTTQRLSLALLLSLTGLLASQAQALANTSTQSDRPALEAKVDRTRLAQNESLTLFLRTPGLHLLDDPDLSELYQDFEVLAQQVRTNIQVTNGVNESERIWEISLLPKRAGTLIIPAVQLGELRSQPITLDVRPAPQNTADTADVFLDSSIDSTGSIYVQQQLIYTLRLYYATSISDHGITPLDLPNTLFLQLGNRTDSETRIQGRTYNVAQWQFAIYPQSSGELVIPAQTFSGRIRTQNRYSLGGLKQVRIQSPDHRIKVKPIPESFPANAQWLPARSVDLEESWSRNYAEWQQGTPLTRSLTLRANGLTAAQLPPLVMPPQEGLRQYPDKADLQDLPGGANDGSTSVQSEKVISIALIPTQTGALSLPSVAIPWWNTETDQLEYARLDALELNITPDPTRIPKPQPETAITNPAVTTAVPDNSSSLYWQISTLLLAVLSVVLGGFLWRGNLRYQAFNKQLYHAMAAPVQQSRPMQKENPIFRQALLNACRQNQARATWDAWQKWQQHEAPKTTTEFDQALAELQQALFGPAGAPEQWQGQTMMQASKGVGIGQSPEAPDLPALYPDSDRLQA